MQGERGAGSRDDFDRQHRTRLTALVEAHRATMVRFAGSIIALIRRTRARMRESLQAVRMPARPTLILGATALLASFGGPTLGAASVPLQARDSAGVSVITHSRESLERVAPISFVNAPAFRLGSADGTGEFGFRAVRDAHRLANGDFVIVDRSGVHVTDETGNFVQVFGQQGCQDGGVCVIVEADADSELALSEAAAIQRAMSLPTSTVSTSEWGDVEFSEVHPNTFVLWSCSGDVVAVAVRSADGSMQRAPITAYEGSLGLYELRSAISVVLQ